MKAYVIGLIAAVVLFCAGWFLHKPKEPKQDARVIERIVIDKHYSDSLQNENKILQEQFTASQEKVNGLYSERTQLRGNVQKLSRYADSLEREIILKNDTDCIKALTAKNDVIIGKDSIIGIMDAEILQHKRQVLLLSETVRNDSLVIGKQLGTLGDLSCAYNWKIRHPFWAWVFRWKCNK